MDDLLVLNRLRFWLTIRAPELSVEDPLPNCGVGWKTPHAYRMVVEGVPLDLTWMDGIQGLVVLADKTKVHICEGMNEPVESFDLADPKAEAALAWCLYERYGIEIPDLWIVPGTAGRRRKSTKR